jgi:hypothetical protein
MNSAYESAGRSETHNIASVRRHAFRFSLADLLKAVPLTAIGCVALRHESTIAASATFTMTVAILCLATVGALSAGEGARPFWTGCAVFGWAHIVLAFYEWRDVYTDPGADWLLTSKLLYWLAARFDLPMQFWMNYWQIGHCLLTLLCGLAGGWISSIVFLQQSIPRERAERVNPPSE